MSRVKDLYCIQQGVPTLHDMLEIMGLSHDPERTTSAILERFKITATVPPKEKVPHPRDSE